MPEPARTFAELSMDESERIAVAVLERDVGHLDNTLSDFKTDVKKSFEAIDKKFDASEKKIERLKDWSIGMAVMLFAAIVSSHLLLSNRQDKMVELMLVRFDKVAERQDVMLHELTTRQDALSKRQDALLEKVDGIAVSVAALRTGQDKKN